jgi:hypothetical protein
MLEALQEFADSRGVAVRVDRTGGVLRGVKLIGLASLNGRRYRPEALSAAIGLYEGAKVNVNHPAGGPLAPRDYRDRLGVVRQVEFRPGEGLFGNLHFNPKHALAEQLAWDAQHNPRNVGFSHNVTARLARDGERTVVEAITHVHSVDLVADPATTQGLFEQTAAGPADDAAAEASIEAQAALQEAVQRTNVLMRRLRILELLAAHRFGGAVDEQRQREELGQAFYETLLAASDEGQLESLIAERAAALRTAREQAEQSQAASRPRASEQLAALAGERRLATASDFARAIRL